MPCRRRKAASRREKVHMGTSDNPWDQVPIGARPPGWIEATENGWGAVAAWFAGVENLVREPTSFEGRSIEVTCVGPDGTERSRSDAFTAADMESIDDDIDSYLADAGVPLRPRGFAWFIRSPLEVHGDDEFWSAFTGAVYEQLTAQAPTPREIAAAAAIVMDEFYRRS
jgi:hypothetical protein